MKINCTALLLVLIAIFFLLTPSFSQNPTHPEPCGKDHFSHSVFQKPEVRERVERIHEKVMNRAREVHSKSQAEIVTIPVVVHVIHSGESIGTGRNISKQAIHSQLEQMNDDFRKMNADAGNVPPVFSGLHADIEIEFCLAVRDPDGNPTDGITRHNYPNSVWRGNDLQDFEDIVKPATYWDPDDYINIWSADVLQYGYYGWAYFPGVTPEYYDGLVCDYQTFGSLANPGPEDVGRTTTHELGHYFSLEHIWYDSGCGNDDGIADTPRQDEEYYGCPSLGSGTTSCGSQDMYMNYMDYVDCVNMFTEGQKAVMRATLDGPRASLKNSMGCVPVDGFTLGTDDNPQVVCFEDDPSVTYTIDITPANGFSDLISFSASGNPTGTNLSFSANPIMVSSPTQIEVTVSGTPSVADGNYNINLIGTAGNNTSSINLALTVSCSPVYCSSSGNTEYVTGISYVSFHTLENADTDNTNLPYEDFTNLSTTIEQNQSYDLSVRLNTAGDYTIYAMVWIDWNSDGDFTDNNEAYQLGTATDSPDGATSSSPLTIVVPADADLGSTRMRVAAKWQQYPSSCENGFDGEVEDYTLNIAEDPTVDCNFDINTLDYSQTTLAFRNGDCDEDGVTNGNEIDPDGDGIAGGTGPNGSATDALDPCDYNPGDITLPVTADQSGCPCTELTSIMTVVPSNIQGVSNLNVTIRISELSSVDTDGSDITVRIPVDDRLTLSYDPSLTRLGFTDVENSEWTYLGSNGLFHEFRRSSIIAGGSSSTFGIEATYDPQSTEGTTTMTVTVTPGSGGECQFDNNTDVEIIKYFD